METRQDRSPSRCRYCSGCTRTTRGSHDDLTGRACEGERKEYRLGVEGCSKVENGATSIALR